VPAKITQMPTRKNIACGRNHAARPWSIRAASYIREWRRLWPQTMAMPVERKAGQSTPPTLRLLPMQLQLDDRMVDERGEWRVAGRPYTTAAGKTARVRVELVGQPHIHQIRSWAAHQHVAVKRGSTN
jgi:hypothetical protein